jgi:hypothetical protein
VKNQLRGRRRVRGGKWSYIEGENWKGMVGLGFIGVKQSWIRN